MFIRLNSLYVRNEIWRRSIFVVFIKIETTCQVVKAIYHGHYCVMTYVK